MSGEGKLTPAAAAVGRRLLNRLILWLINDPDLQAELAKQVVRSYMRDRR